MLLGNDGKPLNAGGAKTTNVESSINSEPSKKIVNFRTLISRTGNEVDVTIPIKFVLEVKERFENYVYGLFLGK